MGSPLHELTKSVERKISTNNQENSHLTYIHPNANITNRVVPKKSRTLDINLTYNEEEDDVIPSIKMPAKQLKSKRGCIFLIDTGSKINIIKESKLQNNTKLITSEVFNITGVTSGISSTIGYVYIEICNFKCKFHVVKDNFNIKYDGIIGREFLKRTGSEVLIGQNCFQIGNLHIPFESFSEIQILPKTKQLLTVNVENVEKREGYIPLTKICNGVFTGDMLVKNKFGKVSFYATNTNDYPVIFRLDKIRLFDFELTNVDAEENQEVCTISQESDDKRLKQLLNIIKLDHLKKDKKKEAIELIKLSSQNYILPTEKLSTAIGPQHRIYLDDPKPVMVKQYRQPPKLNDIVNEKVQELLDNEIIENSESEYNSPLWIVEKKSTIPGQKAYRLVIDFRELNAKTAKLSYPLPNINELIESIGKAKYFSTFDLKSGFHQIELHPEDRYKTGFSSASGHYQFKRLPMGLKNAPASFQRFMNAVLAGLVGKEALIYIDDIIIFADSIEEHREKYLKVMERLNKHNLKINPEKSEFLKKEIVYLGHIVSSSGIKPNPSKIKAVENFPRPTSKKKVLEFLGKVGYYRKFIKNFAEISEPLNQLVRADQKFIWDIGQEKSFQKLKNELCKAPILQPPDYKKQFIITTDASNISTGAVLSQFHEDKKIDLPIAYMSKKLKGAEKNYSATEKEFLAIIHAVEHFRPYVYGTQFLILTDHQPIAAVANKKRPAQRLQSWLSYLRGYDCIIKYKPGRTNKVADALSRNPCLEEYEKILENVSIVSEEQIYETHEENSEEDAKFVEKRKRGRPRKDEQREKIIEKTLVQPENRYNLRPRKSSIAQESAKEEESDERKTGEMKKNPPVDVTESSDSNSLSDSDSSVDEETDSPLKQEGNISYTKNHLFAKKDNIIFATTANLEKKSQIIKALIERKILKVEKLLQKNLQKNEVYAESKRNRFVIALICKQNDQDFINQNDIKTSLLNLKLQLDKLDITSVRISRDPEIFDESTWNKFKIQLKNVFRESQIRINICEDILPVPPVEKRLDIIAEYHNSACAGHKGKHSTYEKLLKSYYWRSMRADVAEYIKRCQYCKLNKAYRRKRKSNMILMDIPEEPFDKIAIDIIGPFATTARNNTIILTVMDSLTRYAIAVPLPDATAKNVARALADEVICRFGAPKAILSDNGKNFLSNLMVNFREIFGIKKYNTSTYHPQSNGALERSHNSLKEYLRIYTEENKEWDSLIPTALFSFNNSVSSATKFCPQELIYGKVARMPTEFPSEDKVKTYDDYLKELIHRLNRSKTLAAMNLSETQNKTKASYDKNANVHQYYPGQYVYINKEVRKGSLDAKFTGPYKVIDALPNNNVIIELDSKERKNIHIDKIMPASN